MNKKKKEPATEGKHGGRERERERERARERARARALQFVGWLAWLIFVSMLWRVLILALVWCWSVHK